MKARNCIAAIGALAGALSLLAGCAPQYAKTDDLFRRIDSPGERRFGSAKLCLVLTQNTDQALTYANKFNGGMADRKTDPKRFVADLTELFQTRFRETVRVKSLDEMGSRQCNIGAALDLKLEIAWYNLQTDLVEITAVLFDDKGTELEKVSGQASRVAFFGPTLLGAIGSSMYGVTAFLSTWEQAIASFGNSLDASGKIGEFVHRLPKDGPLLVAAPAALDLAFWDSVKTSSNPADLQAYLQKFPNGAFVNLARSRLTSLGEAVPTRLTPLALPADGKVNFGGYHALVIGINNYSSVTPLKTAVNDAKTVSDLLQKEYGFKVELLVDATRNQILDAFDDLRRTLTENDNLLIYYAGHGHLDADSDRGFWLPVDADANRRANCLSNSDIADVVRATRAKHVLVVADSCYAGTLTRSLGAQLTALDDYALLSQRRARTALVSGGLEPVEDAGGGEHSVFAKAFLDSLLANTGIVDMAQIFSSMRRQVILSAQQTPQYGDIRQTGHEGGDFIFVRRK
jgi:hypothetical protein